MVRAMIQGSVETLDKSAASMLGLEPIRHVDHAAGRDPAARVKIEALQIDGLTVKDYQGVTRLDNFTPCYPAPLGMGRQQTRDALDDRGALPLRLLAGIEADDRAGQEAAPADVRRHRQLVHAARRIAGGILHQHAKSVEEFASQANFFVITKQPSLVHIEQVTAKEVLGHCQTAACVGGRSGKSHVPIWVSILPANTQEPSPFRGGNMDGVAV